MQQHTLDVMRKLIWVLLEILLFCSSERIMQIDQELTEL